METGVKDSGGFWGYGRNIAEALRQTDIAKETYDLKIHGFDRCPNGGNCKKKSKRQMKTHDHDYQTKLETHRTSRFCYLDV